MAHVWIGLNVISAPKISIATVGSNQTSASSIEDTENTYLYVARSADGLVQEIVIMGEHVIDEFPSISVFGFIVMLTTLLIVKFVEIRKHANQEENSSGF